MHHSRFSPLFFPLLSLVGLLALSLLFVGCDTQTALRPDEVGPTEVDERVVLDEPEIADLLAQYQLTAPAEAPGFGSKVAAPAGCTTITFDAGSGFPPSYTESGIIVTIVPPATHLHLDEGPNLLAHTGESSPYEFKKTDLSAFTVFSLDIVTVGIPDPTGTGDFVASPGGAVEPRPGALGTLIFPAAGWTGITSFRWNESRLGNTTIDNLVICPAVIEVDIDIKPGSFPNSINPKSMGVVPVAILGSATFDVTDVDVNTLAFGPDGAAPAHDLNDPVTYANHLQDVNDDGFLDLVSHYRQKETGLATGDTEACISGETMGGTPIEGCDSVRVL